MTRAKLLATSILAWSALLGATAATQAASHAPQTGPRQVAVDQSTEGAMAQSAQATQPRAGSRPLAQNSGDDQGKGGVEDDDREDQSTSVEDDEREDQGTNVEDHDRDDRAQTGESAEDENRENQGEDQD